MNLNRSRSGRALSLAVALVLGATPALGYEDCGNGYYCAGSFYCSSNNRGCLPVGADECEDGISFCEAGMTCCADGTCVAAGGLCLGETPGENSCEFAYDGACDEGSFCSFGTDSEDCDSQVSGSPYSGDDSCRFAFDGECDEGSYCEWGTDSSDCRDDTTNHEDQSDGSEINCVGTSLSNETASCPISYCIESSSTDYCVRSYYEVDGIEFGCPGGCADLTDCAQEVVDYCLDGGASPSSDGRNENDPASESRRDPAADGGCAVAGQFGRTPRPMSPWAGFSVVVGLSCGWSRRRHRSRASTYQS